MIKKLLILSVLLINCSNVRDNFQKVDMILPFPEKQVPVAKTNEELTREIQELKIINKILQFDLAILELKIKLMREELSPPRFVKKHFRT